MKFFHGTDLGTVKVLSARKAPIEVTRGGGEFGMGFYVVHSAPFALRWAIGRFSLRARILELEIDDEAYNALKRKHLTRKVAKRLTRKLRAAKQTSTHLCGADIVVGPIEADANFEQTKFETEKSAEALNSNATTQVRVYRV